MEGTATGTLEQFIQRYLTAWNDHDAAAMAPLVTEDVIWYEPALPAPARGPAAVQEFMRAAWRAFPDLRFREPERSHLSVVGDKVAFAWRMSGTFRGPLEPPGFAPTGRRMEVEGVDLWELRDGRIAYSRAYYDINDMARQLGVAPAAGSRAERVIVALQRLQARLARR